MEPFNLEPAMDGGGLREPGPVVRASPSSNNLPSRGIYGRARSDSNHSASCHWGDAMMPPPPSQGEGLEQRCGALPAHLIWFRLLLLLH